MLLVWGLDSMLICDVGFWWFCLLAALASVCGWVLWVVCWALVILVCGIVVSMVVVLFCVSGLGDCGRLAFRFWFV